MSQTGDHAEVKFIIMAEDTYDAFRAMLLQEMTIIAQATTNYLSQGHMEVDELCELTHSQAALLDSLSNWEQTRTTLKAPQA